MVRVILLLLTALTIPLTGWNTPYPNDFVLQHIPTVLGIIVLLVLAKTTTLSNTFFCCSIAFLWLHILGARWIYSFVPYDDWARSLTGTTLSERFGWERNHYDRLVHTASGLLGVPIASELLQRYGRMRPLGAAFVAIAFVLAVGAIYEVLEWQIAILFSPNQAEAYNGQQGDMWDPQKDMALAGLGAVIAAILYRRWSPPDLKT